MISFEEAKKKALKLRADLDMCAEFADAYLFYSKLDELSDGGRGPCVILKENGNAISGSAYYTSKMASGKVDEELRNFEI